MSHSGYVYLVGAGPGDPGLLTVRGMELLRNCDCVVYDRLIPEELLGEVREGCRKIGVGKMAGVQAVTQEEINQILIGEARKGEVVVRLKGGDPFVFGRGGEEAEALSGENIPYELVPGVSSAISVPELAGIPLTHRGISRSFHVITGHTINGDIGAEKEMEHLAKLKGTLVFLMGIANIEKIMQALLYFGKEKDTLAAVISRGGTSRQRVVRGTIESIASLVREEQIKAPAIIVVGEIAGYDFTCKEGKELTGLRFGLTGTKAFQKKLKERIKKEGASCYDIGYVDIRAIPSDRFTHAVSNLSQYGWLVFTSSNAVPIFMEYMRKEKIDLRKLAGIQLAVIGPGTKDALLQYGMDADQMPKTYTTKALAQLLCACVKEEKILLVRAKESSKMLTSILGQAGKNYEEIIIYERLYDKSTKGECLNQIPVLDYIVFGSAKGVEEFYDGLEYEMIPGLKDTKIVCIGEITKERLPEPIKKRALVPKEYTVDGMIEAIKKDKKGAD